jgi:hypothetical protein
MVRSTPLACPETDEACVDGRCKIGRCYIREQEIAENNQRLASLKLEEENEVRLEAEKIVIGLLRKKKSIMRHSSVFVAEKAKDPKVMELARKRVAALRDIPDIKL